MRQIYKDFEKEHPEIKLNLMSMTSSDEVIKKTKNMLSVGEVPDLIFTGGYGKDSVYRFMEEKNKAADLMPYLEKDQEFADSVAPEIISYWQKDGKLYTLSDVLLLGGGYWYNADIFEKAGIETLEDLIHYYPREYERYEAPVPVMELKEGMYAAVSGRLLAPLQTRYVRGLSITSGLFGDGLENILVSWFNMPYLKN